MTIACLLAPHLPVQVERSRDTSINGRPVIIGGRPWDPGVVLDCCPAAEAVGVYPGMRLARAEALCLAARFLPTDEPAYLSTQRALEDVGGRFTYAVETAGMGLVFADLTSLARSRMFGGNNPASVQTRLAHELVEEAIKATGLQVQVGLARDQFTAKQAAHAAPPGDCCVVPPAQERAFLSPLQLSTLPADPEIIRRLNLLGIRTLGELVALHRLALIRQFGPQGGFLHDLASGRDNRPIRAEVPPLVMEESHDFEPPVAERGPLCAQAGRIIVSLAGDLSCRGYQAEGLKVQLVDEDGETYTMAAPVAPPTADPARLTRKASTAIERLSSPRPITSLVVALYPIHPEHWGAVQLDLLAGPSDTRRTRLQEAIRQLRERFGEMAIFTQDLLNPPSPRAVRVTTDRSGLPRSLAWDGRNLIVSRVYERWEERKRWWAQPVDRDYYRIETADRLVRVVYLDLGSGQWWLERRHL